jgi:membrane protein required for colicin V production
MAGFDWIIVGVIAISVVLAVAQGFFFEAFSLAGAVLGYLFGAWEYGRVAPWFEPHVKSQNIANAAGFLVIFLSVMILAGIAGRVTRWALKEVGLSWVDRALGAAFGLVRGMIVVTVGVMAMAAFMPESKLMEKSELSRYFLITGRIASIVAPGELQNKLQDGMALLRKNRMEALAPQQAQSHSGVTETSARNEDRNTSVHGPEAAKDKSTAEAPKARH